jgi:glucose-6-phosphate dehydrogenase assembly protein OpcA
MEELVSSPVSSPLPGEEVPFARIAGAMVRGNCQDAGAMRALVATVVAIGPVDRLADAAEALQQVGDAGTVRGILISEGDDPAPPARVAGNTVSLIGLKPPYVNNAVAALRLSSLPTLVWWRGGRPDTLDGLAHLADRIVLDEPSPREAWARAATLFDVSAFSDLRWARLTQCRALTAHFFDIPEVRAAASRFTHLRVSAGDGMTARLFAAWLASSLTLASDLTTEIEEGASGDSALREVRFGDAEQELVVHVEPGRTCVETAVSVRGHRSASRLVSLGDLSVARLITEELRIRARDAAFERALHHLLKS